MELPVRQELLAPALPSSTPTRPPAAERSALPDAGVPPELRHRIRLSRRRGCPPRRGLGGDRPREPREVREPPRPARSHHRHPRASWRDDRDRRGRVPGPDLVTPIAVRAGRGALPVDGLHLGHVAYIGRRLLPAFRQRRRRVPRVLPSRWHPFSRRRQRQVGGGPAHHRRARRPERVPHLNAHRRGRPRGRPEPRGAGRLPRRGCRRRSTRPRPGSRP